MRIHSFSLEAHLAFWVFLVLSVSFCYGIDKTVEVIGIGECADCAQTNIKSNQAFSGLRVIIYCKAANGELKTRGIGELEKDGKFKISLPQDIVENGDLKEQCYAQLHSASSKPCPTHNSLDDSKIVFSSKTDEKQTFTTAGKLKFSLVTCTSAFFWPHTKYPPLVPLPKFPPFPKTHPWKTFFPFPPIKSFPPVYKKPLPPPVPMIFKKPLPLPVPVFKKPCPPSVPKVNKPLPPPVPIYKPKPPVSKPPSIPKILPPPVPKFKKPLPQSIFKPLPPFPKILPIFKKPCPPIPKIPSLPKLPPKYFHHPKFGYFPHPNYSPNP